MMRTATVLFALFTLAVLAQHGPATIRIDAAAKKQPGVTYSHEKHAKLVKACDTCHHTQKGLTTDQGTKVIKCAACHLDPVDEKTPGMREMSLTKNPFHIRCIACHKEQKKGPVACNGCHTKA